MWRKDSINDWLKNHDIAFDEKRLKVELVVLMKQHKHRYFKSLVILFYDFHHTIPNFILSRTSGVSRKATDGQQKRSIDWIKTCCNAVDTGILLYNGMESTVINLEGDNDDDGEHQ